jgi:two-component system chemotaxis sensor kinase CheA
MGVISLRAHHEAGTLVIEVSDDGAGLDRDRIRARARERGVAGVDALDDDELYELVFAPGFSTAAQVTSLSGRGVGLDVVRGNLEALRGTVSVKSEEGRGTTMTIRLPLTVAIIDGFAVGSAGETYLMPLGAVLECREIAPEGDGSELSGLIDLRGTAVPFVRLRTLFGLGPAQKGRESVVIVQHDGRKAGIAVDQLFGESTAVMQPLGRLFDGLPGLAGSTILGTGRVALILDVPTLFKHATSHKQTPTRGEHHGRAH